MAFGKRGESVGGLIFLVSILILFLAVAIVSYVEPNLAESLPDSMSRSIDIIFRVAEPVVTALYLVVAPPGENENTQMIAFAIFLLISIVGMNALKSFFKGSFLPILVSAIVGIISARSLTSTILEEFSLAASPLTAISLVIGAFPVFLLGNGLDKMYFNNYTKLLFYLFGAVIYFLSLTFIFDSVILGLIYAGGILIMGVGQIILPYYRKTEKQKANMSMGRYMAGVQETVKTVSEMQKGSK